MGGDVVIDDDVHPLDIDAAPEEVRCHHDALLELLELLVAADALLLVQGAVDRDGRKVAFAKKLVQSDCALHALHKYDNLKNPAIRKRQFSHVNKRQFSHVLRL